MTIFFVLSEYLVWTYGDGIAEFLRAWGNYHWFLYHFFSINILARTLFAPWHRIRDIKQEPGFDPQEIVERLVVNTVTRLVGFVIRAVFIAIGLAAQAFVFMLGALLFTAFVFAPVLIPLLFISGIALLFH